MNDDALSKHIEEIAAVDEAGWVRERVIDGLRRNVIDVLRRCESDYYPPRAVKDALAALDAAENPDPWELLRDGINVTSYDDRHGWEARVRSALALHDSQDSDD